MPVRPVRVRPKASQRSFGVGILKRPAVEKGHHGLLTVPSGPWFSRPMPAANATALTLRTTLSVEQLVTSVASLALVVVVLITSLTGAE